MQAELASGFSVADLRGSLLHIITLSVCSLWKCWVACLGLWLCYVCVASLFLCMAALMKKTLTLHFVWSVCVPLCLCRYVSSLGVIPTIWATSVCACVGPCLYKFVFVCFQWISGLCLFICICCVCLCQPSSLCLSVCVVLNICVPAGWHTALDIVPSINSGQLSSQALR